MLELASKSYNEMPISEPAHSKVATTTAGRTMRWWSAEEDEVLRTMVKTRTVGNKIQWTEIQKTLSWRTRDEIRGRWGRMRNAANAVGENKCTFCGMLRAGHSCPGIKTQKELTPATNTQERTRVVTLRLRGAEVQAVLPKAITKATKARPFLSLHPYVLWCTPPLTKMDMHPFVPLSTPWITDIDLNDPSFVAWP